MHYTVSFAVLLYIVSAVIDTVHGIASLNFYESYMLRAAAAAAVIATFLYVTSKAEISKILPFILGSLGLSVAALTVGGLNSTLIASLCVKIVAAILTVRPIIELEVIAENEEQ